MVMTISFVSDYKTEEIKEEQGEDTDCNDQEYGDPDLPYYMSPRKQPTQNRQELQ
jgi:hypothetical protein